MVDSYLSKTENRLCEVNPFLAQTLEITEEIANVSAVEFDNWDCEPTPLKKLSKSIQGKILHIKLRLYTVHRQFYGSHQLYGQEFERKIRKKSSKSNCI